MVRTEGRFHFSSMPCPGVPPQLPAQTCPCICEQQEDPETNVRQMGMYLS